MYDGMFLWCVQEVAELKEKDIISHTATDTQLPTGSAVVFVGISRTLSELKRGVCSCYYVLITAENDLCDVLAVIRDLNDWKDLGLQLGLLYSTLNDLETYRHYKPSECRIDMLSAWLQQKDNVLQKGVPSWSVLRAALQSMGEHETADRIHSN